jgi:hypothetical protein
MKLKITDGSGFMALVNADAYETFVNEDWQLTQLMDHFISEMNENNLIIWGTGVEKEWIVDILEKSTSSYFRAFSKTIQVTNGCLYLTNYEDLTMAAQFSDEVLPQKHNSDLKIEMENGFYNVTVKQLSDPEVEIIFEEETNFEITFERIKLTEPAEEVDHIFWWDNYEL